MLSLQGAMGLIFGKLNDENGADIEVEFVIGVYFVEAVKMVEVLLLGVCWLRGGLVSGVE